MVELAVNFNSVSLEEKSSSTDFMKGNKEPAIIVQPSVLYGSSPGNIRTKGCALESYTSIGLRNAQEDRLLLVPKLFHEDITFCGVFDGTVGHYASDYLMENVLKVLTSTEEMQQLVEAAVSNPAVKTTQQEQAVIGAIIRNAMRKTFLTVDQNLLTVCDRNEWHYASSTGVTAFLWKDMLTIAHVGDSKACIAKVTRDGRLAVEWLTVDHKPNMPHELRRIQEHGGSLVWLHGNKAYIRGGDFLTRQARGEHPKQLNYSRAFGGKDLKPYGLVAEPDVNHFEIQADDKLVLIASDGLWDVLDPITACEIAMTARKNGKCATQELALRAVRDMPSKNVCDNVSVIAMFF